MTERPVKRGFRARGLGEIAIRTAHMAEMVRFYRDIVGLEVLSGGETSGITFFRIADGFGGHTQVLALFASDAGREVLHPRGVPVAGGAQSTLHHIALALPFEEQDAVRTWYDAHGVDYAVETFGWIGWRGVFATDPDGNTVEMVAYDGSLLDA